MTIGRGRNLIGLIGVIDVMNGVAVRAVAGRREEYKPVRSRLCDAADPRRIAAAYRERYGIEDLYVADLDGILGAALNTEVIRGLVADGFRVAVDAGLRTGDDAARLIDLGVESVVAGLETTSGPSLLEDLVGGVGRDRLVFSLDLRQGVPLADPATWAEASWDADSPLRIVRRVNQLGIERLIVLDLHAVGTAIGPATTDLCSTIKSELPSVRLWSGGGIRNAADIERLLAAGVDGVLVASALHDETL